MNVEIDTVAEAFFSIGLMVLAADRTLSRQECASIFDSMMSLDVFEGEAGRTARHFLGQMMGAAETLAIQQDGQPCDDDTLILNPETVEQLVTGAEAILSPALRDRALRWAVDLALADGLEERERAMLIYLARRMNVDADVVTRAIETSW